MNRPINDTPALPVPRTGSGDRNTSISLAPLSVRGTVTLTTSLADTALIPDMAGKAVSFTGFLQTSKLTVVAYREPAERWERGEYQ